MKSLLEAACPECGGLIRAYRGNETERRRIRSAANQHALSHHPWMGVRERSRFADEIADEVT